MASGKAWHTKSPKCIRLVGFPEDGQPLNKEGAKFNDIKKTTTNNPIQSVASTALSNP
ncbi:unnamed protein product [Arabidopsis thaliana]|uniref:(thale cress) hypothetical protein n=1 Tax=Arabidopsis thaliana TaxID=3702 RepID=A0A7G2E615_ARATH|nr:unnamed protein product [Arabidopsis thaliana]